MDASGRSAMDELKSLIREVPDFPKPGILFYDITTALKSAKGLKLIAYALAEQARGLNPDLVAGIESRGFLFGLQLAADLGTGFAPVRKPGKLPAETTQVSYELEYGSDTLEIHTDAVEPGQRVLIVDDLLATGGTAAAAVELIESLGGTVAGLSFVIELGFLNGRAKLDGHDVAALLRYDS